MVGRDAEDLLLHFVPQGIRLERALGRVLKATDKLGEFAMSHPPGIMPVLHVGGHQLLVRTGQGLDLADDIQRGHAGSMQGSQPEVKPRGQRAAAEHSRSRGWLGRPVSLERSGCSSR